MLNDKYFLQCCLKNCLYRIFTPVSITLYLFPLPLEKNISFYLLIRKFDLLQKRIFYNSLSWRGAKTCIHWRSRHKVNVYCGWSEASPMNPSDYRYTVTKRKKNNYRFGKPKNASSLNKWGFRPRTQTIEQHQTAMCKRTKKKKKRSNELSPEQWEWNEYKLEWYCLGMRGRLW